MRFFGILSFVWILMLLEFIIIAGWIADINDPIGQNVLIRIGIGIFKVGLSGILGLGWLYLWNKIVKLYFWRNITEIDKK